MRAAFGMYPFASVWPAYQELWRAVAERVEWLPRELEPTDDVHSTWADPSVVVGQICGWPAAVPFRSTVQVFGAFCYDVPHAVGHRYRSTIIATRPGVAADFAQARAVANNPDSLSGFISLLAGLHGKGALSNHPVVFSGAHVHSLAALRRGEAEVAAIDSLSLHHILHENPSALDGLHRVGVGPLIPSPPLYTLAATTAERVADLRRRFAGAVADRALASSLEVLRITGFVSLESADYDEVVGLVVPASG
jgi:ABC-type phosphate/phosphonate transport system substrate-binding protein